MEFTVKFIGRIDNVENLEDAEKTMFSILKKLDEHFEEYSASLEEDDENIWNKC